MYLFNYFQAKVGIYIVCVCVCGVFDSWILNGVKQLTDLVFVPMLVYSYFSKKRFFKSGG